MKIIFFKYQGAGNDFVMIDNRLDKLSLSNTQIAHICDRKFGIGADGLIFLSDSVETDFKMVYYNSDGTIGSMCGNGGRCIVAFAQKIGIVKKSYIFEAYDGLHHAEVSANDTISLQMSDVTVLKKINQDWELDTGSLHLVRFVPSVHDINVKESGAEIRFSETYFKEGINVNYVEVSKEKLLIRTYERGVEAETLACGTGATASAIAAFESGLITTIPVKLKALGGDLEVRFTKVENSYTNIKLIGSAKFVFKGSIHV
mgnify:CR=1 FL=1